MPKVCAVLFISMLCQENNDFLCFFLQTKEKGIKCFFDFQSSFVMLMSPLRKAYVRRGLENSFCQTKKTLKFFLYKIGQLLVCFVIFVMLTSPLCKLRFREYILTLTRFFLFKANHSEKRQVLIGYKNAFVILMNFKLIDS